MPKTHTNKPTYLSNCKKIEEIIFMHLHAQEIKPTSHHTNLTIKKKKYL